MACTVWGESTSTPCTTLSIRPALGPSTWLARRTTVTVSATSASTAPTTSAVGRLAGLEQAQHAVAGLDQHRIGLEGLEGSGQPPAVALVVMALAARVGIRGHVCHRRKGRHVSSHVLLGPRTGRDDPLAAGSPAMRPSIGRYRRRGLVRVRASGVLAVGTAQRGVDPRQALLAAQQGQRLEDPGRHGVTGQGHADGLKHLAGLETLGLGDPAQRRLERLGRKRIDLGQGVAGGGQRPAPPSGVPIVLANAAGSSTGPSKTKPTRGQKSARVWIFSREMATAPAQARRAR